MPYQQNPYRDPYGAIGQSLGQLGQAFLSGPSPIEQDRMAADTAYKNTQGQLAAQQFEEAKRNAAAKGKLSQLYTQFLADPSVAPQLMGAAIDAGVDPGDIGTANMFVSALTPGATEEQLRLAGAASGKALGVNDAYTLGGSQMIRDQNAANDYRQATSVAGIGADASRDVAGINNRGALERDMWNARNKPLPVDAGQTVYTMEDGKPTLGLQGMQTESTAKGSIIQDLATGSRVPPQAQAVVGAMEEREFPGNAPKSERFVVTPTDASPSGFAYETVAPGLPAPAPSAANAAPLRLIPTPINEAIVTNISAAKQIDRALQALETNPAAVGVQGYLPDAVLQRLDPAGVEARALIADIGSLRLHDRSGAAITAAEFPRLRPFIPNVSDTPDVVRTKLINFRRVYLEETQALNEIYSTDSGYQPNKYAQDFLAQGGSNAEVDQAVSEARAAIEQGADEMKVRERFLRTHGYDFPG